MIKRLFLTFLIFNVSAIYSMDSVFYGRKLAEKLNQEKRAPGVIIPEYRMSAERNQVLQAFNVMRVEHLDSAVMCGLLKLSLKYAQVHYDDLAHKDVPKGAVLPLATLISRSQQKVAKLVGKLAGNQKLEQSVELIEQLFEPRYQEWLAAQRSLGWLFVILQHFDELKDMAYKDSPSMMIGSSLDDNAALLWQFYKVNNFDSDTQINKYLHARHWQYFDKNTGKFRKLNN